MPIHFRFRLRFLHGLAALWLAFGLTLPVPAASAATVTVAGKPAPAEAVQALNAGTPQDLIILFDDAAIETEVGQLRRRRGVDFDTPEVATLREARYRSLRDGVRAALPAGDSQTLLDYSHLPLSYVRINSKAAFDRLLADPRVRAAYANGTKHPVLDTQSQGLVRQPQTAAQGLTGSGTGVVIIDTGANYTVADLGSCTAPGTPASCHVVVADAVTASGRVVTDTNPVTAAANDHGTNVASIVAGIAPSTHIVQMNVFGSGTSTSDTEILGAINWALANQAAYSIRAVNMSLGDGSLNTSPCSSGNPYVTPVANLRNAGIVTVVAAGNDTYTNGISNPACTPHAVSVGAVYSGNFGGIGWSVCTDNTTAADQVTCFSNSATFLTLLAPGALITAGGQQMGGTSQATPFVTASAAVLRAAYPTETVDQTVARMTGHGVPVIDTRNSISKPRLDLFAAAGLTVPNNPNQDVPTLPEWAAVLCGALLLLAIAKQGRGGAAG